MPSWTLQVFFMEFRKLITYRADFWVNFIGRSFFTFVIFYYLWKEIFEYQGLDSINGYSLNKMVLYYLVVPILLRAQQGENIGSISREIYEGSLNKYLLYPINFYLYKVITYLANATFYFLQVIFVIFIFNTVLHDPDVFTFNIVNFLMFIIASFLASLTYFSLSSIPEVIAFWADNIWSLSIILRYTSSFLGGGLIPLAFFPEWTMNILKYTPFPYIITLPMEILFNQINYSQFLEQSLILIFWFFVFLFLSNLIWQKGKFKYTGVGI